MLPPPRPPAKVGRKGKHVQRTLPGAQRVKTCIVGFPCSLRRLAERLDASDLPSPGFVQSFCASQKLSDALQAERLSSANGQAQTDRRKQEKGPKEGICP